MTGWRVDPAGLNRILTETDTAVQGVQTALAASAETLADVQEAGGYDGIVSSAFSGFLQETYDGVITRMFGSYAASLEGTANAANTYLAGDEEMAATIASGIAAADFDAASYLPPPSGSPGGGGGGGGR
jgi:hypothetical protein